MLWALLNSNLSILCQYSRLSYSFYSTLLVTYWLMSLVPIQYYPSFSTSIIVTVAPFIMTTIYSSESTISTFLTGNPCFTFAPLLLYHLRSHSLSLQIPYSPSPTNLKLACLLYSIVGITPIKPRYYPIHASELSLQHVGFNLTTLWTRSCILGWCFYRFYHQRYWLHWSCCLWSKA